VSWLIVGGLVASAAADFALLALYLDNPSGSWPMADLAYLLGCGAIALAALSSPLVSKVARPTHPVSTSQLLPITVGVLAIVPPVLLFGIALRDQGAVRLLPVSIWLLVVTILAVCRGVAGRQVLNETMKQVQWYATHDPVTGMYERATFMDLASRGGTRERGGTVLYLDVDGFRAIGDQYGQEAVEVVLVEIADRLRQVLSDGALLARLSYDEFASFVRSSDLNRGRILAESVQTSMREPVLVGDVELFVSVSVGVAQVDGAVIDLAAGLRRAGLAMRHAKSIGPGGFAIDAELAGSPLPEDAPSIPRLRATSGSPTFA